jgi:hypothetical protein
MRIPCFLLLRPLRAPALFSHCVVIHKKARPPYLRQQTSRAFPSTSIKSIVSTMDTTRALHEPIEDVERMEYCRTGGYHPVTIGDHFHNRYRVVHKLGHGTYSTILLARDDRSNKYVAVKVCTADWNPLEIDRLSKLSKSLSYQTGEEPCFLQSVID